MLTYSQTLREAKTNRFTQTSTDKDTNVKDKDGRTTNIKQESLLIGYKKAIDL